MTRSRLSKTYRQPGEYSLHHYIDSLRGRWYGTRFLKRVTPSEIIWVKLLAGQSSHLAYCDIAWHEPMVRLLGRLSGLVECGMEVIVASAVQISFDRVATLSIGVCAIVETLKDRCPCGSESDREQSDFSCLTGKVMVDIAG